MRHANQALIGLATIGLLGGTVVASLDTSASSSSVPTDAPVVSDPYATTTTWSPDVPVGTDPPGSTTTAPPTTGPPTTGPPTTGPPTTGPPTTGPPTTVPPTTAPPTTVPPTMVCLGGRVWLDRNANGDQNVGEPGISGVYLDVMFLGADGFVGGGDDELQSFLTDAEGDWFFEIIGGKVQGAPPGKYIVTARDTSTLDGLVPSFDPDSGTSDPDGSFMIELTSDSCDQNLGYRYNSSIGDTVVLDANGNMAQDPGEAGIPAVDVTLIGPGPDLVLGTGDDTATVDTTDGSGRYLFDLLPRGDYRVDVDTDTLPTGYVNTFDEDGDKDSSTPVSLGDDDDHLTADFGYQPLPQGGTASIGDTIYLDLDGNGTQDGGEPGVPAQTVKLTRPDGSTVTTTTDGSGRYLFDGLPDGDYVVMVVGGIADDAINSGDPDDGTPNVSELGLAGGDDLDQDFGYTGTTKIGDTVWNDLDTDGVVDDGEPGIPGVDVTIVWLGADRNRGGGDDVVIGVFTSDGDGKYLATDLPAGRFSVDVTGGVPAGFDITFDPQGTDDPDGKSTVTIASGRFNIDQDFGYTGSPVQQLGSIGDRVFLDTDGDMVQGDSLDEPGIGGVTLTLRTAGPDGLFDTADDVVSTDTTDGDGNYLFDDLPAGGYRVAVDTTTLPAGLVNTFDEDGNKDSVTTVTLGAGQRHVTADFGYFSPDVVLGSIGDRVFLDTNADGAQGDPADEPGIVGTTVELIGAGPDGEFGTADDTTASTTTGADGEYLFTGLTPGTYRVTVTGGLPDNVTNTVDPDGGADSTSEVMLAAGQDNFDQDFGYDTISTLGDRVWLDDDRDGVQDPGEVGINGVTVIATYFGRDNVEGTTDDISFVTVTSGDGDYLFSGVRDGAYRVKILRGVPVTYTATFDADSGITSPDGMTLVSLTNSDLDQDFGFAPSIVAGGTPGTVNGRVWRDNDKDGVQDPGEPGIPGITVNLVDDDGNVVATTVTTTGGGYTFTGVTPGDYRTVLDTTNLPDDLVQTFESDGTSNQTVSFTVASDQTVNGGDYGYGPETLVLPSTGFDPLNLVLSALGLILLGLFMVRRGGRPADSAS